MSSTFNVAVADVQVDCAGCKTPLVVIEVPTQGLTVGEVNDYVEPRVVRKGWSVRRGRGGGREFCCPHCTAAEQAKLTGELAPYSAETICPKCRHDQVATRYWTGRETQAPLGVSREHLGRTCGRCGYVFVQACADRKKAE
jgi:hypothetical protein